MSFLFVEWNGTEAEAAETDGMTDGQRTIESMKRSGGEGSERNAMRRGSNKYKGIVLMN